MWSSCRRVSLEVLFRSTSRVSFGWSRSLTTTTSRPPTEQDIINHDDKNDDEIIPRLSSREKRLSDILSSYSFTGDQVKDIISHFRFKSHSLYDFDPDVVRQAIEFWVSRVVPGKSRREFGLPVDEDSFSTSSSSPWTRGFERKKKADDDAHRIREALTPGGEHEGMIIDGLSSSSMKRSLRSILSSGDHPTLLLIDVKSMEKRIQNLQNMGFMSGRRDLWTVFESAPIAFFLQDWSDFNRKFYFLHHRVMGWMVDVHEDPFPTPHPCVRHARVLSLPYFRLKARFEFAVRTGLKSPATTAVTDRRSNQRRSSTTSHRQLDFESLFLTSTEEFVRRVAPPRVSEEEYYVLEEMSERFPDEEDDVIREVVRLQLQGQTMVKNARISDLTPVDLGSLEGEGEDEDSDSDSDESTFRKTHRLTECLPSGKRKVYRSSSSVVASSEAEKKESQARERVSRLLTHLQD